MDDCILQKIFFKIPDVSQCTLSIVGALSLEMSSEFTIGVESSLQPLSDSHTRSIEGGTLSISFSTSDSDEQDFSLSFEATEHLFSGFFLTA